MKKLNYFLITCSLMLPVHYIYSIYIDKIIYNNESNKLEFKELLIKYFSENCIILFFEIVFLSWIILFEGFKSNKQQNKIRDKFKLKYKTEINITLTLVVLIVWTFIYLIGFKGVHINFIVTLIFVFISYPIIKYLNVLKRDALQTSYFFIMFVMSFHVIKLNL